MHPSAKLAARNPVDTMTNSDGREIYGEAEGAEDVVEENGDLETITAAAAVGGYDGGEGGEGREDVAVRGAVVQPQVFVGDGGDSVDVELGEEVDVARWVGGVAVGKERRREIDVGEELGEVGEGEDWWEGHGGRV